MTLDMKRLQTEKTQLLEEMAGRITQDVATATAEHQNKITELLTEISTLQTVSEGVKGLYRTPEHCLT